MYTVAVISLSLRVGSSMFNRTVVTTSLDTAVQFCETKRRIYETREGNTVNIQTGTSAAAAAGSSDIVRSDLETVTIIILIFSSRASTVEMLELVSRNCCLKFANHSVQFDSI